jgi:tripartite-type tricarboxylate transporter receptor subunit TctC
MKKTLIALAMAMAVPAAMAWQPTGDINMIVAYKAGSGTDTGARLLVAEAGKVIKNPIIIQNLPGADGKIGWKQLVTAKPDGQTIGFINLPTFTTLANQPGSPFTSADIVPIANHLTESGVIAVKADSPYKTIDDLVKALKAKGNLKASTNGNKASNHTAAQLFTKSAGVSYKAVPYGGTADQLLALRSGEVDFTAAKVADVAKLATGDKPELRVLAVFDSKRAPEFPEVPTLKEKGYYPQWYGSARAIVAPKNTPPEVIAYYVDAFKKVMSDPEVVAAHKKAGMNLDFKDNKELGALIKEQDTFARDVISKLY